MNRLRLKQRASLSLILALIISSLPSCQKNPPDPQEEFYSIEIGSSVASLEKTLGPPYSISQRDDGLLVYEYTEKLIIQGNAFSENHYYFLISNNLVVGKYSRIIDQPGYNFLYIQDPNHPDYRY